MNLVFMLSELRSERQQIEEAILVLERLAASGGKRRGRPPKWTAQVHPDAAKSNNKKKRVFSLATRRRMAAAQQTRWAKKRAKAA
jgi:hypothetical protein